MCWIFRADTERCRLAPTTWSRTLTCETRGAAAMPLPRIRLLLREPTARSPHPRQSRRATMKQQANLIRAGQVIEHEGRRWTVLKQQIITPGKGGAFIQVEMRDLKSGNKTNERWRTADTVERLMTEEKEFTYSYTDGANLVLMDPESYEETHIPTDILGDLAPFLQDNMQVTVDLVEGDPVGIHLPPTVILEV